VTRKRKPLPETEFSATVTDLDHDGRGVARVDGKVTFIFGALPGETVRYKLQRVTRALDEAVATAIDVPSPDRVTPGCAHFGTCGGCSLQHLAPAAQVAFKQQAMLEALRRIGGVTPETVAEPVLGPVWGYRRRARMGVKLVHKKGGVLVGFRERDANALAVLDRCEVVDPRLGERLRKIGALFDTLSIADQIPQIEVSASEHVAVTIRVLTLPSDDDRAKLLAFAAEHDFDFYLQPGGPDSLLPLADIRPLDYSPDGSALRLNFLPADFIQINADVSQRMVNQALDWLNPAAGDSVLELFAGLGNFTLPIAARGAQVTAVEGEAGLVARGLANLQRNGFDGRFLKADLFKPEPKAEWLKTRYDLALIDPPRSGAKEILPMLAATKARRIVYVSCHPGTLARDAGELVNTHGYRLTRVGVLDMFPHTTHVESMALFERP